MTDDAGTRPLLRVVRGDATAEETAALVATLALTRAAAARQAGALAAARRGRADARARSGWCDRSRLLRQALPHGPGSWRASALPR